MLMEPHPSEPATVPGPAEYLPMKDLQTDQIYTAMNPQTPTPPSLNPRVIILTPNPEPSPPPLPPKTRRPPRRSVSLNSPRPPPQVEVEELKMTLRRKEDDLVRMWMDLVLARKQALRARHQKKKQKILITLLMCLLVCMSLSVMLYFLIRLLVVS